MHKVDAQGWRVITVLVHVWEVKIYVAATSGAGADEKWNTGWNSVYQGKKDIVFRFIIEYSSLRDFGPY
jgi:hypothetical protein